MPLTPQQAFQIAQLLGQYQDVARFVEAADQAQPQTTVAQVLGGLNILGNPLAGAIYGMTALSFVYTFDAVYKDQNYPAAITRWVNLAQLNNPNPNAHGPPGRPNETPEEACLRHLRNCFAHGRFLVAGQMITLEDFNAGGVLTFRTHCDVADVVALAEHVLVEAHNIASAIWHQGQPVVAAGGGANPAAAAPPGGAAAPGPVAGGAAAAPVAAAGPPTPGAGAAPAASPAVPAAPAAAVPPASAVGGAAPVAGAAQPEAPGTPGNQGGGGRGPPPKRSRSERWTRERRGAKKIRP